MNSLFQQQEEKLSREKYDKKNWCNIYSGIYLTGDKELNVAGK